MKSLQKPLLLLLAAISALAAPVVPPGLLLPRHESRILPRQLSQPVSFQTVDTTQTQVGTVTQTCKVTLTPITGGDGAQSVREDKDCTYVVLPSGQSPPPPPPSNSGSAAPPGQTNSQTGSQTDNQTDNQTNSQTVSTDAGITTTSGATSIPVSTDSITTSPSASATETSSETPESTLVATTSLDDSTSPSPTAGATDSSSSPAPSDSLSTTSVPVTITSVLPDGSTTTLVTTTPSAVQAQGAQEEVPGRKLEVLPIGLGVFAGISVIALIIVGLVTYERTKYRRAFRQRKLAEAGANMGYGGMAERT